MKKLRVALNERSYDILIEKNILKKSGEYISRVCRAGRVLVVTDTTVEKLYAKTLQSSLEAAGWDVKVVSFTPGETSKSLESVSALYREAFAFGMTRSDMAIALGGGVIGDLTGFFAATLFRGISFIQIPTTLLAQVDSSVGGKTGVNVPAGKNLVGCFYQPKLVLIDPETLQSLSERDFYDGMAEVIKYGCICNTELFDELAGYYQREESEAAIENIIYLCCNAKRSLVETDEFDTGSRMLLNFGHTVGHVIEKSFHFSTYTHGQAVAIGMVLAARLGEKLGITAAGTSEKIVEILKQYFLPTEVTLPKGWEETMLLDKKMKNGSMNFIILEAIGKAQVVQMPAEALIESLQRVL